MRVAIPTWDGRVSPVFDTARELLLLDIRDSREFSRANATLSETTHAARVARLNQLGVEALVCGAVSCPLGEMIKQSGIRLTPFIAGDTEGVIAACLKGELARPVFAMPGCWKRRRGRPGRGFRNRATGGRQ